MSEELKPDPEVFRKLLSATMPFGKYAGKKLIDLPEPYVVWFKQKGFPKGELGQLRNGLYDQGQWPRISFLSGCKKC